MGCGSGVKAQINMPQTVLTSRVMGRGASGASHVSRDSFALPHPYCEPSPVPSRTLHGASHLPSVPTGIHRWGMGTSPGISPLGLSKACRAPVGRRDLTH